MGKQTLYNDILCRQSITVISRTANATVNGTTVDMVDGTGGPDGFTTAICVIVTGVVTDGSWSFTIEDSDDNSNWATATGVQGTSPVVIAAADDNVIREIGYTGGKRYVRASVTSTGSTTGAILGALFILGGETATPVRR